MSPILKRDLNEQLRQARRLAAAVTGYDDGDDDERERYLHHRESYDAAAARAQGYDYDRSEMYSSGTLKDPDKSGTGAWADDHRDEGIGSSSAIKVVDVDAGPSSSSNWERRTFVGREKVSDEEVRGLRINGLRDHNEEEFRVERQHHEVEDEEEENNDPGLLAEYPSESSLWARDEGWSKWKRRLREELLVMNRARWHDLRDLLLEATPSLLFNLVGEIFTGELLEHLARWRVFLRVDELFILVPMIGNLNGNLEMCLSARLGTSANIGELDSRKSRKRLLKANMTLLGMQALLIASLAAILSFGLGWITTHRLGDTDGIISTGTGTGSGSGSGPGNYTFGGGTGIGVGMGMSLGPGLEAADQEWHEGNTRPGWKQLVMVIAVSMGSAGISSAVLGSFMGALIVLARWTGIDPDNITPPVASCLGDLLTLFILALLGSLLVGTMDTPIPLICVVVMVIAAIWFTRVVLQDEWVKNVAKGGWLPLVGAMLISSGTGMVLDQGVGRYRGFALLAIATTGLTGSIGAIHANRLSTSLHARLHPTPNTHAYAQPTPGGILVHGPVTTTLPGQASKGLTPTQSMLTLFALSYPVLAIFYGFVKFVGWIDVDLGWVGWLGYTLTTGISLALSHWLTLFFWSKNLDPDSYTLPIHSALVDFIGQLLLMASYEVCIWLAWDVTVKVTP